MEGTGNDRRGTDQSEMLVVLEVRGEREGSGGQEQVQWECGEAGLRSQHPGSIPGISLL